MVRFLPYPVDNLIQLLPFIFKRNCIFFGKLMGCRDICPFKIKSGIHARHKSLYGKGRSVRIAVGGIRHIGNIRSLRGNPHQIRTTFKIVKMHRILLTCNGVGQRHTRKRGTAPEGKISKLGKRHVLTLPRTGQIQR